MKQQKQKEFNDELEREQQRQEEEGKHSQRAIFRPKLLSLDLMMTHTQRRTHKDTPRDAHTQRDKHTRTDSQML